MIINLNLFNLLRLISITVLCTIICNSCTNTNDGYGPPGAFAADEYILNKESNKESNKDDIFSERVLAITDRFVYYCITYKYKKDKSMSFIIIKNRFSGGITQIQLKDYHGHIYPETCE